MSGRNHVLVEPARPTKSILLRRHKTACLAWHRILSQFGNARCGYGQQERCGRLGALGMSGTSFATFVIDGAEPNVSDDQHRHLGSLTNYGWRLTTLSKERVPRGISANPCPDCPPRHVHLGIREVLTS